MAKQEANAVRWQYRDPANIRLATAGTGSSELASKVEFDPMGAQVDDDWARYSMGSSMPRTREQ